MKKNILIGLLFLFITFGVAVFKFRYKKNTVRSDFDNTQQTNVVKVINNLTVTPTTSAKALDFDEMNKLYGPCGKVKVLMYHHIEDEKEAKKKGQINLAVNPSAFKQHLQYLKDKNYNVISINQLDSFLKGGSLPAKPVLITLDDAYEDNYTQMFPILKEFGYHAIIFTPTGLISNPDYLNWDQIREMNNSGLIYFGNHTWSHHSSTGSIEVLTKEIGIADEQLTEKGLNNLKVFAYPFGKASSMAEGVLKNKGYNIAFTTTNGTIMCKGKSLELPRIRVGNASLVNYGL